MAIAATMNKQEESSSSSNSKHDDHENDVVMPGFRFHPTEEELVEFYLRRKVEGKRFNVELITSLDLYRFDPWELPALAAMGEKEWYFYVPRDRKYRNGDRPNRVTKSGYWKATGADRMIRSESSKAIGLKKTLVFYSGKAPKGIRSSWIMNEYRLPQPQNQTQPYPHKAEISLCRVYKRPGVEDHPSLHLPRCLPTKPASSSLKLQPAEKRGGAVTFYGGSTHQAEAEAAATTIPHRNSYSINPLAPDHHHMQTFSGSNAIDDLHKLVHNYASQQSAPIITHETQHPYNQVPTTLLSQFPLLQQPDAGEQPPPPGYSDRLWEWNATPEVTKDYNNLFN